MPSHDAFVSYSRKDRDFASRLEKALENFVPPKGLPVPQRHLDIFRDEDDFTGTDYYQSLEKHFHNSANLIVLCSPYARESQYVNDEIRRFAKAKGPDHIIPLLISGLPNNEAKSEHELENAFPDALLECMAMPLATEYRGFDVRKDKFDKGRFENSWYTTLANIYGIDRGELEQRDKKRQERRRRILIGIGGAVGIALTGLTVWALISRNEAVTQARIALSRQLAVQSRGVLAESIDRGLLLSVAAVKVQDTLEARQSLLTALQAVPRRLTFLWGRDSCHAVGLSADGRKLAMASGSAVVLWDVVTGRPIGTLADAGRQTVTSVRFLSRDKKLVATSLDGALLVWDLANPNSRPRVIETGAGNLFALAVSPDESTVALGGAPDGTVQLWHTTDWKPYGIHLDGAHGRVWTVAFSSDGSLAAGTEDGNVVIWKGWKEKIATLGPSHQGRVWKVAFSFDDQLVASAGDDGEVKLWNAKNGRALDSVSEQPAHNDGAMSLAFSPDGRLLATGGRDGRIMLWNLKTRQAVADPLKAHRNSVLDVSFSPDGALLASASADASVILWNALEENPLVEVLRGHRESVLQVDFVQDRRVLVSRSTDRTIIVWDLEHRKPSRKIDGSLGFTFFSPDFNVWAFADSHGNVQLYDMRENRPLHESLKGNGEGVIAGAFSPDGKILATGSQDGAVTLWNVSDGKAIHQPLQVTTQKTGVTGVAFNAEGTILGTVGGREITFWDVSTRRKIGIPLVGHSERRLVWGLNFSANGHMLASSSFDGTISLWDVASRRQFGELQGNHKQLFGLAFSRDGKTLAAGAADGTVLLWHVDLPFWQTLACAIANRNLTRTEWEEYVGRDVPYVAVCPDSLVGE